MVMFNKKLTLRRQLFTCFAGIMKYVFQQGFSNAPISSDRSVHFVKCPVKKLYLLLLNRELLLNISVFLDCNCKEPCWVH